MKRIIVDLDNTITNDSSSIIDSDKIILCGKPDEYEKSLKQNFKNG